MKKEEIHILQRDNIARVLLAMGLIVGVGLGIMWIYQSLTLEYVQILTLSLGLLCFTFGLVSFKYLMKQVELHDKTIWIRNVFKITRINLDELIGYSERSYKTKYGSNKRLVVRLEKESYSFYSSSYYNYYRLKEHVAKNSKDIGVRAFADIDRNSRVRWQISFVSLSVFCFFASYSMANLNETKQRDLLEVIEGTLLEEPKLSNSSRSKGIKLKLSEYPDFRFYFPKQFSKTEDLILEMAKLSKGSKLTLWITLKDYNQKIGRTIEPGWINKHINWRTIQIQELIVEGRTLLRKPEETQRTKKSSFGILIWFMFGIMSLYGLFRNSKRRKIR